MWNVECGMSIFWQIMVLKVSKNVEMLAEYAIIIYVGNGVFDEKVF